MLKKNRRYYHQRYSRFVQSASSNDTPEESSPRSKALHDQLEALGIDAYSLDDAALQSIHNPTNGYDVRYGKSAIRTYRSFVNPRQKANDESQIYVTTAAARCAIQVDFLIKRHKSREAEWIRHTDTGT